jgi:hypothetical protein
VSICTRRDRDRRRHSELIRLGAAGAGKSGKIGVCVTLVCLTCSHYRVCVKLAVPIALPLALLLASSFTSRGVHNSAPCKKACHTTN